MCSGAVFLSQDLLRPQQAGGRLRRVATLGGEQDVSAERLSFGSVLELLADC